MQKFIEPDELLLNYGACPSECRGGYGFCTTEDHRRCAMKIYSSDSIVDCPKVSAILLDDVKKAREEINDLDRYFDNDYFSSNGDAMFKCSDVLAILDKLIESEG